MKNPFNLLAGRKYHLPYRRRKHWSYDTAQIAGLGKVKVKPAKPRVKRKRVSPKLLNGRVLLGERRKRTRKAAPRRLSKRLIDFRKGDYVLFNPEREGYPVCIDGTVLKVRRCFDRRREEFIVKLRVEQTGTGIVWTLRHPGVAIRKVKR